MWSARLRADRASAGSAGSGSESFPVTPPKFPRGRTFHPVYRRGNYGPGRIRDSPGVTQQKEAPQSWVPGASLFTGALCPSGCQTLLGSERAGDGSGHSSALLELTIQLGGTNSKHTVLWVRDKLSRQRAQLGPRPRGVRPGSEKLSRGQCGWIPGSQAGGSG